MDKRGFTLLELLMVVLVIGILAGMVLGASLSMKQTGRKRRAAMEAVTLENAIKAYRVEYGRWPVPAEYYADGATNNTTIWFRADDGDENDTTDGSYYGDNGTVFEYLDPENDSDDKNPRRILFVEKETFALDDDNSKPDVLTPWGKMEWFADESKYKNYYKISIDLNYPASGGTGVDVTYEVGTSGNRY